MTDATLRPPDRRSCERCDRQEIWTEADDTWRVVRVDDEPQVGDLYCIHEWDINGSFLPIVVGDVDPASA